MTDIPNCCNCIQPVPVSGLSTSDIISILTFFTVIIGGLFAFHKWRKDVYLKRAEYINVLTEKIRTDSAVKDVLYMFEYGAPWYDEDFHDSGELELKVDKTLSFFSYICYLIRHRIITKKEVKFFEYKINIILQNLQVQDYLYNIYHYADSLNAPATFYYLIRYGLEKGLMHKDFLDASACQKNHEVFHYYLNF